MATRLPVLALVNGLLVAALGTTACDRTPNWPTAPGNLCCWVTSGRGDSVVSMPEYVERVRVSAYVPYAQMAPSAFVIWINHGGGTCSTDGGPGCRMIVNELLGRESPRGSTHYEDYIRTGGGGTVTVFGSADSTWTLTEN